MYIVDMECRDNNSVVAISKLDISYQVQNITMRFYKVKFSG